MQIINITDAKAHLSSIIANVESSGEEVLIKRMGKPIAKISPYEENKSEKRLGFMEGQIEIAEDFDKWPEDIAKTLGIID